MEPSDNFIRITTEEANSRHVDDLLKRQMSLRGEQGIARDAGRAWYLQSWLVLGLTGMLAAIAAWALLEPFMEDSAYLQGKVSQLELFPEPRHEIPVGSRALTLEHGIGARVEINNQTVWIMEEAKEMQNGHGRMLLDFTHLRQGMELGVYIRDEQLASGMPALGHWVDTAPPPLKKPLPDIITQAQRSSTAFMLFFALVASFVGLGVGAVDGIVCRLLRRALLCGAVGLLVGFIGGFMSSLLANIVYSPISHYALSLMDQGGMMGGVGYGLQIAGRTIAWALAGLTMGLGQGIALRSTRLLLYGFIGGVVGGLLGGMFFDPIGTMFTADHPGAETSRFVGLAIIGLTVGAMIGVVELIARDAWLRMVQGPLRGKEFLLFKDVMQIGSSPKSDLYLFNDAKVAAQHAIIRAVGDDYDIEARHSSTPVNINGINVTRARLRNGDQVGIGATVFTFQKRKG